VGDKRLKIVGRSTEKNGANKVHGKRVTGCARGPNIHHQLVITFEDKFLPDHK